MKFVLGFGILLSVSFAQGADICAEAPSLLRGQSVKSVEPEHIKNSLAAKAGVSLTDEQAELVSRINKEKQADYYFASDLASDNKKLKKAGLKDEQINKLRASGVLNNSIVKLSAPTKVQVENLHLRSLQRADTEALQKGEKRSYVITQDGNLHITPNPVKMSDDTILISDNVAKGGLPNRSAVIESGEMIYDSASNKYVFQPKHAVDVNTSQAEGLLKDVTKVDPGAKVAKGKPPIGTPQSQAANCLDILSAQSKGKNFVLDRLIGDNAVASAAIISTEMMGAGRFEDQRGQEVVMADLIGINMGSLVSSQLGKHLVLKNANLPTSLAARTGVGLTMIEAQKQIYQQVLTEDAVERSEDIANFDRAHFAGRLLINHHFDKFVMNSLPKMIFDSCQKNSKMQVFISPRAVRLYERFGSSTIYYGARSAIIGE